jgi:hypothetical protein
MRTITDHKLNGLNEALKIQVTDEPGAGGANHVYVVYIDESLRNDPKDGTVHVTINFQNGPIQEEGVNGISGEALMAIQIDRLRSFQAGPYACRENALALTALEESLMWLQKRTRDRLARGVEGTSQK